MIAVSFNQFLLPLLSTFHSAFIHIERTLFIEMGGKDMRRIVGTKCFLNASFYKRLNRCTGMRSVEKII